MLGVRLLNTSVVSPAPCKPVEESLTINVPVVIEIVVPCGLLFAPNVTEIDVWFTTNPITPGDLASVTVPTSVL